MLLDAGVVEGLTKSVGMMKGTKAVLNASALGPLGANSAVVGCSRYIHVVLVKTKHFFFLNKFFFVILVVFCTITIVVRAATEKGQIT